MGHRLADPEITGQAVHLAVPNSGAPTLAALAVGTFFRCATGNATANETCRVLIPPVPIAEVVMGKAKKRKEVV